MEKGRTSAKGRVEKLRTNILYPLLPRPGRQNLQSHGIRRKSPRVFSCPRGCMEITEWPCRRACPRLLGSPGTKAEGDPQFCGCRSPSVSALPGPKGISASCSLTNLAGTFFLQHSFMHLYPPPTLQDSGGEEVQTLVSL